MSKRKISRSLFVEPLEGRNLMAALPAVLIDDAYEPNDTFSAAKNLGTVAAPTTLSNLVMADRYDWFKFTTTKPGATDNVALSFQHAQGDLELRLYSSAGRLQRRSATSGNGEHVSLNGLAAGTYYVRISGDRGATNPAYSLTVNRAGTATPPADDTYENNDTRTTARDLGALTAAATFSSLVLADTDDWYRFSMSGAGVTTDFVGVNFKNSQGNIDLELYNSNGTRLAAAATSNSGEQISLAGRASGTYYVRVHSAGGATNPSYSLQIDPGTPAAPPPPVDPPPSEPPPTEPPPAGSGAFDIQFTFSGLTTAQQAIFEQAAQNWESVIVGDLPNATYNGVNVDDVLIGASAVAIDGVSGILGQAGPDRFRSTGTKLPYHGIMQFDSFDIANMESKGTLLAVIEHEMGHVLGVGTLWSSKGLLTGSGTSDPLFIGAQAVAAYNSIFGTNASGVPVENTGGSGTRNSHWRESIFKTELMTGWVGPGANMPLSRITVASLADVGYTVNLAAADVFSAPAEAFSLESVGASWGGGSSGNVLNEFLLHESYDEALNSKRNRTTTFLASHIDRAAQQARQRATDEFFANWLTQTRDLQTLRT